MIPGPRLVLKVVVVAAVLLFARLKLQPQNQPIASASPTPDNTSPFNLKVQTNLVVVRVVVRNGKGEPVEGLKKDDFQLFDRHRKQTIAQFEGPTSTAENAGSDTQRSPIQTNIAPAGKPAAQRFLALYFDDLDMTVGDVADARTATDRFLKANFQPSLRVALFNTSGLLSDFTDDKNQIHEALFRLQAHRHNLGHTDCLELSDYQAEQITKHDDPGFSNEWNVAIDEAIHNCHMVDPKNPPPPCDQACVMALQELLYGRIRNQAERILDESQMQSRLNLQELGQVTSIIARAPGQRNIILVSPGFESHGAQNQLDLIIDRALRAEVVISSIDPRGLAILMRESDASQSYTGASQGLLGAQYALARDREISSSSVLAEVAAGTGGTFFHNNNDLVAGLHALTSSAGSYVLAFAPTEVKEDGKFHELKVKLTEKHPGFTVQARRGYFTSKTTNLDADTDAKAIVASAAEIQVEDQIRQALLSKGDVQQLPVELDATLADPENNRRELHLVAHLDTRALRFHKNGENNTNAIIFVFAVFDEKGGLVDSEQRRARVDIPDAQLPELFKTGMDVEMSFRLPPANYRIRQIVADSEARHMTTLSAEIKIPPGGPLTQGHWMVTPDPIGGSTNDPSSLPQQIYSDLWSLGNTTQSPLQTQAGSASNRDANVPANARKEYAKGNQLFTEKDFAGAARYLVAASKLDSNFVAAHIALGSTYLKLGQPVFARDEFAKVVALDDHLPNSYMNLAYAQIALKDYISAEASVEKAAAIAPLDLQLATALAYLQLINQHYDAVLVTATRVHSEKHEGAALVHYYAAAAWQAKHDLPETRRELETLLREDPMSPVAEQARLALSQINEVAKQPKDRDASQVAPASPSETGQVRSQLAAQTAKEQKEIAEAEAASRACATCDAPRPPAESANTSAQSSAPDSSNLESGTDDPFSLRSVVDEVGLLFAATDHGRPVIGLTREEVHILDNRRPPEIITEFHGQEELPLRLGVILDTSQSVAGRFSFEQHAAIQFLQKALLEKDDRAFVVGVANSVLLVQDFTADQPRLSRAIGQLAPTGGTAIWDAVAFASRKLARFPDKGPVARALVVISDGKDNASRVTLKEAIQAAQKGEVFVCTVSVPGPSNGNERPTNADTVGENAMRLLAEQAGGAALVTASLNNLDHSLDELQQVLRSRYLISYKPALFQSNGEHRTIDISAEKSGRKLHVYARKGYFARTTSANN